GVMDMISEALITGRGMRVLLAGELPKDRELGRRAALRIGLDCAAADCVSLSDLRLRLAREPAAHMVVVFLDPNPDAAAQAIKWAADQTRQPIYAVTAHDDAVAGESAKAAGATDVWKLDDVREGLLTSSEGLRRDGRTPERRGRVIAVTAAQPGVGVT